MKLFDISGKEIPERPSLNDGDVFKRVAENAATKFLLQNPLGFETDDEGKEALVQSLIKNYSCGEDSYELAKKMEFDNYCWDIDKVFVDELDDLLFFIRTGGREEQENWVKEYSPQPQLKIGDSIELGIESPEETGVIDKIDLDTARYHVKSSMSLESDTSRYLIQFEDARKVEVNHD